MSPLWSLLRCLDCGGPLELSDAVTEAGYPELGPDAMLICRGCGSRYPVVAGTPRMLPREMLDRLWLRYPRSEAILRKIGYGRAERADHALSGAIKQATADTFTYSWEHFEPADPELDRKNFLDYLQPHTANSFAGRLVLDVGSGSGRKSAVAATLGSEVVAVDLGGAIDTSRKNLPPRALTVEADAERIPFEPGTFDFVMSIGVLHHLAETEGVFASLVPFAQVGGYVHVYLYWLPERRWHRWLIRVMSTLRKVTMRFPSRARHLMSYPVAAICLAIFVAPNRSLRRRPRGRRLAGALPLSAYADYPFADLVGAVFEYLSAPVQRRFTEEEVRSLLIDSGLDRVRVIRHYGWIGDGQRMS